MPHTAFSSPFALSISTRKKKGLAIGIWGLVAMVGPVIGPTLGGWITDNYGWGWIFYINVPLGLFAGIVTYSMIRKMDVPSPKKPIDHVGLVLFLVGISSLQIMLDRGNDLDWWGSNFIVTLSILSVILLVSFVIWEIYQEHPIIDIKLFKDRNFAVGTFVASFGMMVIFSTLIIEPLWVQAQLGYTPLWSGLTLAPFGFFAIILFPLLGRYLAHFNKRLLIAISLILFAFSNFVMSNLYLQVPFIAIALPRLTQGAAFALLFVPITALAITDVPEEKIPSAAGIFSFMRMLFVGIGVSLAITFWQRRSQFYHSRFAEYAIPSNPYFGEYLEKLETANVPENQGIGIIYQEVINQAFTMSILDLFYLGAWICLIMLLVTFAFKEHKKGV